MSFFHIIEPGSDRLAPALLLLHGTGGDEHQLTSLARAASPGSTLIALRGDVIEDGVLRFFRRFAEGQLDEDDLRRSVAQLRSFLADLAPVPSRPPVAVGYSNGANLAAAALFLHPSLLGGAALLRAVAPFRDMPAAALADLPVLMLSGSQDDVIDARRTQRLEAELARAAAAVDHRWLDAGHDLSDLDPAHLRRWLQAVGA